MITDRTDILFDAADALLEQAELECEKPEEDAVAHLVCHHSRLALANYLAGFLIRKQMAVHHPVTMNGLLEQCRKLDARFENIDLSPVHCRFETHDFKYCLDMTQVDSCFHIARQIRDLIKTDAPAF